MEEAEPRLAVVLCDTYATRFGPLSVPVPEMLFPFGEEAFLHRFLASLCGVGVRHAVLVRTAGKRDDKIREMVDGCSSQYAPMKVDVIAPQNCDTVGDALRELDSRKIVTRHDFLLFSGDVLTHMKWDDLMKAHKENVKRDRGTLMTMAMAPFPPAHPSRSRSHKDYAYVTENDTGKLLDCCNIAAEVAFELPSHLPEFCVRDDIHEAGIYVCGPGVPAAFSDNFDFQTMADFVRGILHSEEILGSSLYLYIAGREDEVVCRTETVSSWSETLGHVANRRGYTGGLGRHVDGWNFYRCHGTTVERGANIRKNVYLATGSTVSPGVTLNNAHIGENVKIGQNSVIVNSTVWKNSVIGRRVELHSTMVGENVTVGNNIVCVGCILGNGVVLKKKPGKKGRVILRGLHLCDEDPGSDESDDEDDEDAERYKAVMELLAEDSKAFLFYDERETEEDAVVTSSEKQAARGRRTAFLLDYDNDKDSSLAARKAESEDGGGDDDDEESESESLDPRGARDDDSGLRQFEREVADSLTRGVEDKLPVENLILEINSSKHAYNVGFGDVIRVTTKETLRRLSGDFSKDNIKKVLARIVGVVVHYVKRSDAQVMECLKGIEEYAAESPRFRGEAMLMVLNLLYAKEVISESVILQWNQSNFCRDPAVGADIRTKVKPFIEWLETAEEESDSEEEDSD